MDVTAEIVKTVSEQQHNDIAPASIIEKMVAVIKEVMEQSDEIIAAIVTSSDGLPWAQILPDNFDDKRFSAMSSALLALSMTMAREAGRGGTKNLMIEAENGNIYVLQAGPTLLLTVFTKANKNIGLTLAPTRRASEQIAKIKKEYDAN